MHPPDFILGIRNGDFSLKPLRKRKKVRRRRKR